MTVCTSFRCLVPHSTSPSRTLSPKLGQLLGELLRASEVGLLALHLGEAVAELIANDHRRVLGHLGRGVAWSRSCAEIGRAHV